jgi:hypothetical protein
VGFDAALMAEQQSTSEVAGFIVGVSGNAEQSVHVFQNKSGASVQYLVPSTLLA